MRPLTWDSGVRWDDPNLRWGDPSYILEPGDPGYTPPAVPPSDSQSKQKTKAMSTNATPRNLKVLRARCHDLADGLEEKQVIIGIKQNTAAAVRADLMKIEGDPAAPAGSDAQKGSFALYELCKQITAQKEQAMIQESDGPVLAFLTAAQGCLEQLYGKRFNPDWSAAGWPGGSTAIPRPHDQRLTLCSSLRAYLAANPAHEHPAVAPYIPFTAAEALARHTALSTARAQMNTAASDQEACQDVLEADEKALRRRFSGTVSECRQLLPADSALYEALGLNIPANPTPPEPVTATTATPAGPGRLLIEWLPARRAEAYRVMVKVVGTDPEPVQAERAEALEYTLKNLPAGATVEIRIIATNEGGDAAPGPLITATAPA